MMKATVAAKKTKAARALLVAYHVLHDDATSAMTLDSFKRFLPHILPGASAEAGEFYFGALDQVRVLVFVYAYARVRVCVCLREPARLLVCSAARL